MTHLKTLFAGLVLLAGTVGAQTPRQYTGPGSCSAVSCHGGVQPRNETAVLQNEYSVWVVKDKHAKAFDNLSLPIAIRMGKILGLKKPPNQEDRCKDCHALNVADSEKAKSFDQTDGVGCESCHGPASGWLGDHTRGDTNWPHQKSVDLGMIDLRKLDSRTAQCMTCHLGTDKKYVDHELIAAGHPDLYFELASFSAVMPRHWKLSGSRKSDDKQFDAWSEVHELAIGQAAQLRAQMDRVVREAKDKIWPEYAEMDCFTCHHSLPATKDSWRQDVLAERRFTYSRQPGNPPFNMSRYVILRKLVAQIDPAASQQLESAMARVYETVTSLKADRGQAAAAASNAAQVAGRVVSALGNLQVTPAMTMELMKAISSDSDYIAAQGERAAEQAAMSLDALYVAYTRNTNVGNADRIRTAIHGLFQQLEEPSGYNAPKFAAQLRAVGGML